MAVEIVPPGNDGAGHVPGENLHSICLARQPIVNARLELVGFELLFRSTDPDGEQLDDAVMATSTVIANTFIGIGLDQVLGNVDGYLNVDSEFLFSDLIESLPAEQIVLELLETTITDERVIDRVQELRAKRYRIAIDNFVGNFDEFDTLLRMVDIVKIDFERIDPLLVPLIVDLLGTHRVRLVASKVETHQQFVQARELGIKLFQGYHFARPELLSAKRAKPTQLSLMRLLTLSLGDAETSEIEAELTRHPDLTVNLLRLTNSAALGRRQRVTSLRHALMLIGRRQLGIWLQLLLFTADGGAAAFSNPLLQVAAVRGRLMNQLAERMPGSQGSLQDLAFITGILSLMDVVMEMPMENLLAEVNVLEVVRAALMERGGPLGTMLALCEALEVDDTDAIHATAAELPGIDLSGIAILQLEAFRWATEIVTARA